MELKSIYCISCSRSTDFLQQKCSPGLSKINKMLLTDMYLFQQERRFYSHFKVFRSDNPYSILN